MPLETTPLRLTPQPLTACEESSLQAAFFISAEPWLVQSIQRSHKDQVLEREILISMGLQTPPDSDSRRSPLPSLTLGAYLYTPLVFVAWANPAWYSVLGSNEKRQAMIGSLLMQAVAGNPLAFQLIQHWTVSRPPRTLWQNWVRCATKKPDREPSAMTPGINREMTPSIHRAILEQCEQLAQSTTNLSINKTQLKSQQRMLRTIAETLNSDHTLN